MTRHTSPQKQESTKAAIAPSSNPLAPRPFAQPADAVEAVSEPQSVGSPTVEFSVFSADSGFPPSVQPKLTIGAPNDPYEQEADRVAKQVVQRIHAPQSDPPPIQRATGHANAITGTASPDLETSIHRARGLGQPLAPSLQQQMGQAMGADFSSVRVHTDTQADQLNRSIQAKAFTTGQDVFFRQGAYQPGSQGGQELIAHELTHVVQQNRDTQIGSDLPINRQPIAIAQTTSDAVVQPARGKVGRIMSDLAFLPLLGVGAIGAEVAARMTFGWEKDRKKIQTPTNQLDHQGTKSYVAQDIAIAGGGFGNKYILRGRRYDPKPAYTGNPSAGKAVILFSGSGGPNEDMMEPVAEFYCRQGAVAFGVNYRGYGNSRDVGIFGGESTPFMSEQGLYDDARKIFNYVNQTAGFAATDITLHGFSLGGAVASHLAKKLAKPGPGGQPGVQLGGLVLHSSIKSAYKAARDETGIPGLAQIAGLGTKGSAGNFDTEAHLEQLAARDPNLPIHFMGGNYGAGDQLALSHTQLEQTGHGTFTNVSSHSGQGGHLADNITMPQLTDPLGNPMTDENGAPMYPQAVPSNHLSPQMKDKMATLVAQGRTRNAALPMNVAAL
ncbi:DUF4157 domain-containing protein [Nodosilinea sp. E11]|uniref:eCIS core domain-containing protein n=1 Tax=Nodosilinea sp. E11 TaxID=3037479 RepID=UPI002934ECB0|nr:DUF4157 domain-containing protein [Nodosilinea sp. E11]WOD37086.1 DUF4157 domain-containing protein [Nodosilinea sp. E11]